MEGSGSEDLETFIVITWVVLISFRNTAGILGERDEANIQILASLFLSMH